MSGENDGGKVKQGGCLCGQVRYRITGDCRHIINCHCENCRRTHGHFAAYTSVEKSDLVFLGQKSLKWFHDQSPNAYRGFCDNCGASLFWYAANSTNQLAVAAGTLDGGHGLKSIGHIYVSEAGNYYQIKDGLPQFETSSNGSLDI